MWIAAFMVTGFGIASVYAVGMLRGPPATATTGWACSSR